jgi:hypothetical protein
MFNLFNAMWVENQGNYTRLLGGFWCTITTAQMNAWEIYLGQNHRQELADYLATQAVFQARINLGVDTVRNMAEQLLRKEQDFYLIAKNWYENVMT